ncbi:MAG: Acg family FMN-binding oxidoreductase [Streptosporangiaceae bacterium]
MDIVTEMIAFEAADVTGHAQFLIDMAARAPSVHNSQPWRFRIGPSTIECYCDKQRKLRTDILGREMLISCGAALFGLRLGVRSLGYLPVVRLLPDPARPWLVARVGIGGPASLTGEECQMLEAVPHRHTHRGPFEPGPLPDGLLRGLRDDALAEGATLTLVKEDAAYQRLAGIVLAAANHLDLDSRTRDETLRWTRDADSAARDGVSARTFAASAAGHPGRLTQRDFDLGRGLARLPAGGEPPAATAVLQTPGENWLEWLHAGQALHRLLLHAASERVFASLYTQPLELPATRALIRDRLALPGNPQVLLQLGCASTTEPTARRPADELIDALGRVARGISPPGSGSDPDQIRPSECPFVRTRRSHRPPPYTSHIVLSVCRSGGQGRNAAARVHLPNQPRHHAGTSAAGMRVQNWTI